MSSMAAFLSPPPFLVGLRKPLARTSHNPSHSFPALRRLTRCRAEVGPTGTGQVVHYFAYFSNINPVFLGPQSTVFGRRCDLLETRLATLHGFRLVFNVPGLPPEPVFANIEKRSGSVVKGVLYSVRASDFRRIALSEGYISVTSNTPFPIRQLTNFVPVPRLIDVKLKLDDGTFVVGSTFQWTRNLIPSLLIGAVKPSRRYVNSALDGARLRGIDPKYVREVLAKVQFERGPLGAFGLFPVPQPARVDATVDVLSQLYSPFASLDVGKEAVDAFRTDDNCNGHGDALRLVELSPSADNMELLYFVPGIDGSGRSILSHVRRLKSSSFQVCSVVYPHGNRQSLTEVASTLAQLIATHARGRRVNIVAESMGAAFSLLAAAHECRRRMKEGSYKGINFGFMLLINPATSFSRATLAPVWMSILRTGIPDEVYRAIVAPLVLPFAVDTSVLQSPVSLDKLMKAKDSLIALDRFADVLPHDMLRHRVNLLQSFTLTSNDFAYLREVLGSNIAMICSENDRLLPSLQEGLRFQKEMPQMKLSVLPYGGHTILQDTRFNLADYVQSLIPLPKKASSTLSVNSHRNHDNKRIRKRREAIRSRLCKENGDSHAERPTHMLSAGDVKVLTDFITDYNMLFAPVFVGEERLPPSSSNRPVILVSNHTLLGQFDGIFIIERLLRQRGILVKSMASRVLFRGDRLLAPGAKPVSIELAKKFGLTSLSPRSFGAALAVGEWTLLFPGGAREALKRKSDAPYSLHWGPTTEFVRFAALFGAVIIPVSTVGTEDMVRLIVDGPEIQPTIESLLQRLTNRSLSETLDIVAGGGAKAWKGEGDEEDVSALVVPIGVPTGLERFYYRFGEPVEVPIEAFDDTDVAGKVYAEVKRGVEEGVRVLLERREHDAYRSPAMRARFALANGIHIRPPAGPGWAWSDGQGGVRGEDLQPRMK